LSCPLCQKRKGKRACPGKGELVCAHCCGSKRLVLVACPPDCAYLTGAHAAAWEGRETEKRRDSRRLAPYLEGLSAGALRVFVITLAGLAVIRKQRPEATDATLLAALAALRKTVETRIRGILYEHPPEDLRAMDLLRELRSLFEPKDEDGRQVSPADEDLLAALTALESCLEEVRSEGLQPTAFLDIAVRLMGQPPAHKTGPSHRLIV
jgi:hypothetical protein